MAITKVTPSGVTFDIVEPGEPGWGDQMTAYLCYLANALVAGDTIIANEFVTPPVEITVDDGAVLDTTGTSTILVSGTSGPVTLDPTTPLLSPENKDGKRLTIIGNDLTNTVTIPDDAVNTDIAGPVTLGLHEVIELIWLENKGMWIELARNN